MASLNYQDPGVYSQRAKTAPVVQGLSTATCGFVGVCKRGRIDRPFLVTSFADFVEKCAKGMDSPYLANSYLAWAVDAYFKNGGGNLYISRAHTDKIKSAKATVTYETPDTGTLVLEADDPGAWGNSIKVSCTKNELVEGTFDVTVKVGTDVETHSMLSNDATDAKYFIDYLTVYSKYIHVLSGKLAPFVEAKAAFSGGDDGEENLLDKHYLEALNKLGDVEEVVSVAIPGATSDVLLKGICDYVDNHKFSFAALDAPMTYKTEDLRDLRKKLSCKNAVLLSSWVKVNDELSSVNGKLRAIPTSGGYLGILSATQTNPGPWKDPAGADARIRGAVELVFDAQSGDRKILNPIGVVSISNKKNMGIVVWGARSITTDTGYLYVSAIMMDIYVRKSIEEATQSLVFEPNKGEGETALWSRIETAAASFLDFIMRTCFYGRFDGVLCSVQQRDEPEVHYG